MLFSTATDIFFGRVNYGVVKEPVTDETSFLFKGPLDGHDALADCSSDFTMLNLYSRGPKFVVEINCNGETKWAHYESTGKAILLFVVLSPHQLMKLHLLVVSILFHKKKIDPQKVRKLIKF